MIVTQTVSRGYLNEDYRLFHIRDQKDMTIEAHFHAFDKIVFFLEGGVNYVVEDKAYRLEPGDVLFIRHDEVHRPIIDPNLVYDRWILYLDQLFLQANGTQDEPLDYCFEKTSASRMHLLRGDPETRRRLTDLLEQLMEAEKSTRFGRALLSKSLLYQILILLSRALIDAGEPNAGGAYATDEIVTRVVAYMQDNLADDLSVDALSARFGLSPSLLLHRFRRVTGYTPHGYVQLKRLLYAAEIISGGAPAGEACRLSGYHDYSVFSRAFTKRFGVSPSRFEPDTRQKRIIDE